MRTGGAPLNYSHLSAIPPADYYLGPDDVIEVTVPDLFDGAEFRPLRAQVMGSGEIQLPMVGAVKVGGMNLQRAQQAITAAYANGFLVKPRVSVALAEKATVSVVVLGKVNRPGVVLLTRYENDIAHALAQAGGLAEDAAERIEVHRRPLSPIRTPPLRTKPLTPLPGVRRPPSATEDITQMARSTAKLVIPLRGLPGESINPRDVVLRPDDVIVVPNRRNEVFYVVGQLDTSNVVRFTAGERERELGGGFILPRDREVDVVTAVAMAGYIDPIDSPTTVTVHRTLPCGDPLLINVDLIKARFDRRENVNVLPGDIIYLNPDGHWYFRRTLDRIIPQVFTIPYQRWVGR